MRRFRSVPALWHKLSNSKRVRWPMAILAVFLVVTCVNTALETPPDPLSSSGNVTPVIIDCTGTAQDGYALVLAGSVRGLDVRGVTTVYGDLPAGAASQNTLSLVDYIGLSCPVAIGATSPLRRARISSTTASGAVGLCNVALPVPHTKPDERPAWQLIYDEAVAQNGRLQLICLGPLTNVATALQQYPDLAQKLAGITLLAGELEAGTADANALYDPHALDAVLHSGVPLLIVPFSAAASDTILLNPCPVASRQEPGTIHLPTAQLSEKEKQEAEKKIQEKAQKTGRAPAEPSGEQLYWSDLLTPKSDVYDFLAGVQQYADWQWKIEGDRDTANGFTFASMVPVLATAGRGSICSKVNRWVSVSTTGDDIGFVTFSEYRDKSGVKATVVTRTDRTRYLQAVENMSRAYT